jgi:hypothetical protein
LRGALARWLAGALGRGGVFVRKEARGGHLDNIASKRVSDLNHAGKELVEDFAELLRTCEGAERPTQNGTVSAVKHVELPPHPAPFPSVSLVVLCLAEKQAAGRALLLPKPRALCEGLCEACKPGGVGEQHSPFS